MGSGIVLILFENNSSSVAYTIAAIILEGAGVIPLMMTVVEFLWLMCVYDFYPTFLSLVLYLL